jgi:hypothetical protein
MVLRVAQFLVAPTVRFNAAAIFTNGSLPAILLRRARSSGNHERLVPDLFFAFDFFCILKLSQLLFVAMNRLSTAMRRTISNAYFLIGLCQTYPFVPITYLTAPITQRFLINHFIAFWICWFGRIRTEACSGYTTNHRTSFTINRLVHVAFCDYPSRHSGGSST